MAELAALYTTCGSEEEAVALARALVDEGLVACGNIIPGLRSIYKWRGEVHDEPEVAIIFKTAKARAEAAMARIEELHAYDEPGIEIWPVERANAVFGKWIVDQTS